MIAPITMASLVREIPELVGERPAPRWKRARGDVRGSDGESRESFFARTAEERIQLLRDRMTRHAEWSPLLEVDIPKASGGVRAVAWATVLDTGFIYLLTRRASSYAETLLGPVAIGYRPGLPLDVSIRRAVHDMRRRRLHHACVLDIANFFPSIPWKQLDAVIDALPADGDIAELLKKLVRARVQRLDGTNPNRTSGIPAGLPIAPVLANLVLANLDRRALGTLARRRVLVVRFADDILLAAPNEAALLWATGFIVEQLRRLRLQAKAGTGEPVDLRTAGASIRWLGIELVARPSGDFTLRAPERAVFAKGQEIRALLDAGFLSGPEAARRLRGVEQFYRALLPDWTTDNVLKELRSQIFPDSWQGVRSPPWSRGQEEERKVSTPINDDLLHPLSVSTTIPKPLRGPKLDGDRGEDGAQRSPFGTMDRATEPERDGDEGHRAGPAGTGRRPEASSSVPSLMEELGKEQRGTPSWFRLCPSGGASRATWAEGAGTPAGRRSGDPLESALERTVERGLGVPSRGGPVTVERRAKRGNP